ncbi:precorrin-2 C20-methyltransferase /cobalt-factor II C20-methyltransferase [Microbispora rosea]|uniref:Precorrin-2 C20-methyltransferase /cobalt-factor II C20-methyltransferase n=1 Tax=Microbispora rosea TaxID=58117 RepID=A0A1N6XF61_9ACTN|nr:precorrin-2 C(20)-methyltransferase [Microbispora rosea]GIH52110.1 precorrin-2 C(20)-methyltransferase [Microbispora rosea subsp. rosea]SIR00933.1 precorrin-2 C20-methyltransferase /cobalt-factor II C20-methyltransferase [Microbispora rosea]
MSPVLFGVGVGPGDPDLVTVKAVRVLRESDVVVVPVADTGEEGRAERIVRAHTGREVTRLEFALNDPPGSGPRRATAWDAAGAAVAAAYDAGASTVAFATIGDPNVYSTFTYLAETVRGLVPEVEVRTVPGVTAMQALAASSGTVLVEGRESLALMPLTAGLDALRGALDVHDTVVAYKGGRMLPQVLAAVRDSGRLAGAVYGASLGLPQEDVRPAAGLDPAEAGPYLSALLVTRERTGRGGRL